MSIGIARRGEMQLECPFCRKAKVKVFHKEGYMQAKTSRISAGARVTRHAVPDFYEVLEDCPGCGAKRKDIRDFFEGKYKRKISHEEGIELLKKRGLPLVLRKRIIMHSNLIAKNIISSSLILLKHVRYDYLQAKA
jgi:hypothetical protein